MSEASISIGRENLRKSRAETYPSASMRVAAVGGEEKGNMMPTFATMPTVRQVTTGFSPYRCARAAVTGSRRLMTATFEKHWETRPETVMRINQIMVGDMPSSMPPISPASHLSTLPSMSI